VLNRGRVPEIANYIAGHPKTYVLSALTASIDSEVQFEPCPGFTEETGPGTVKVPMAARLLLHDGLHRRAAIEAALQARPELAHETISLVLFVDPGLKRSEQLFTDLKRHEIGSSRFQEILCDHRDEMARLARAVVARVNVFTSLTEMVKSKISNRSLKLFTLSGIYQATKVLLADKRDESFTARVAVASDFWSEVAAQIPDWQRAQESEVTPAVLRKTTVHAHALALAALGRAGRTLFAEHPGSWKPKLPALKGLDWSRSNSHLWEGRAMIAGRLSKSTICVLLTGNAIKRQLGLALNAEEQAAETRLKRRR
jgi:DNA sulfur modification protein DndB